MYWLILVKNLNQTVALLKNKITFARQPIFNWNEKYIGL